MSVGEEAIAPEDLRPSRSVRCTEALERLGEEVRDRPVALSRDARDLGLARFHTSASLWRIAHVRGRLSISVPPRSKTTRRPALVRTWK
jgi:hypothetical protein